MTVCWSHSEGERPFTVTVYERHPGGLIYARVWDATARGGKGNWRRISLGHRDKKLAKRYAREEAPKLEQGASAISERKVTVAQVFSLYEQYRTPKKVEQHQREDRRRIEMWTRVLGNIDPHKVTKQKWEAFVDARLLGAIDPRGNPVAEDKRQGIRARSVEIDCKWLSAVFTWASTWTLDRGGYLMRENPVRGYAVPKERNVRRPIATQDRYELLRARSDEHKAFFGQSGTLDHRRSYLSELLDMVNGTGRRISAVCSLCVDDLRLQRTKQAPYGAIVWPASTDKMKRQSTIPISPTVRAAIDRMLGVRMEIGHVPLFPAPEDPTKALSRHTANKWLIEGEKLAEVEKQKGGLWHPYRRKWATERKHLPRADVAATGDWNEKTLSIYMQADEATMLSVVLGGGELREAK